MSRVVRLAGAVRAGASTAVVVMSAPLCCVLNLLAWQRSALHLLGVAIALTYVPAVVQSLCEAQYGLVCVCAVNTQY